MRYAGRFSVRVLVTCALALTSIPAFAPADSRVGPLAVGLIGDPLVASPTLGTIGPPTNRHVYTIDLEAGDVITLSLMANVLLGDLDLHLYRPGTTDPVPVFAAVGESDTEGYPEKISFLVPPSGDGTYYVAVSVFQPLLNPMSYTLSWSVARPAVHRIADVDRYATSIEISRSTFATSSVAVLATGADYPDALAASALAGVLDAPLLLVRDNVDSPQFEQMLRELGRLGVTEAYLVGGTGAVSKPTLDAIKVPVPGTKRLAGGDRYQTARKVADEVARLALESGGSVDAAFLVRGDDFADALAAGPYAFSQGMPVLLTKPGALDPLAAAFIEEHDILDVTVVGGEAAVSRSVFDAAKKLNGNATVVERVDGVNRYATAANLAVRAVGRGWATWDIVGIATGEGFPDALSGSAAVGRRGGALLLTQPTSLTSQARKAMGANVDAGARALVFGGTAVIHDAVLGQVAEQIPVSP